MKAAMRCLTEDLLPTYCSKPAARTSARMPGPGLGPAGRGLVAERAGQSGPTDGVAPRVVRRSAAGTSCGRPLLEANALVQQVRLEPAHRKPAALVQLAPQPRVAFTCSMASAQ